MKKELLHKPFILFGAILDKLVFTHILVLGLPTILYYCLLVNGGNLVALRWLIPILYVVTSIVVISEALATLIAYRSVRRRPQYGLLQQWLGRHQPPPRLTQTPAAPVSVVQLPRCSMIVAAYLPNEQDIICDTLESILVTMDRPAAGFELILAYNRPVRLAIEDDLEALAQKYPELVLLNVEGSRSKAENVNAALRIVTGEVTGILDADDRPNPDCFERAWRWLQTGQYAAVQGRNVIRNYGDNFLTRLIGVEFECIYGVSHPAKSLLVDTGLFCGSNGYWRTNVLRRIRFSHHMLTEDIDATFRAMLRGLKVMHDPAITTTELAPVTLQAFWSQRKRWAQGWIEVAIKHQMPLLRSRRLDGFQKAYWTMLLVYSAAFHFIALQVFPMFLGLTLSQLEAPASVQEYVWFTTVLTLLSGPIQTVVAWRVRSRMTQQSWRDYLLYCLVVPFYCIFKNVISTIAVYDHFVGDREWVVTSRSQSSQPAPVALPYAELHDRAS